MIKNITSGDVEFSRNLTPLVNVSYFFYLKKNCHKFLQFNSETVVQVTYTTSFVTR